MPFNYEQSIWGSGNAELAYGSPAFFRFRQVLFALRTAPSGAKILEVGAGAGQFIRALKRHHPEWRCHGTDISKVAIDLARRQADGVEYDLCSEAELPYADNVFDAVLVLDVLEHVENPNNLLSRIGRVLKPDGIFYCFAPCEGDALSLWRWLDFIGLKKDLTKKYAGHINFFKREEVINLLQKNFLSIKRIRYSEHLLGQLAGIAAFVMMDRKAKQLGQTQLNNESFFSELKNKGGWIWRFAALAGNLAINLESMLCRRIPSPNAHIIAVNKK